MTKIVAAAVTGRVFLTWSELGFDDRLTHYLEPFGWGTPPTVVQTWTSTRNGEPILVDDG